MRVKRTTYAARPGNDEIRKIDLEIKQFQDNALKKDKLLDEYVKTIHCLKREYQNLKAEKDKLTDFLKQQDKEKEKIKQESLINQYSRKTDFYNKMM